jgi:hypothetical protein
VIAKKDERKDQLTKKEKKDESRPNTAK